MEEVCAKFDITESFTAEDELRVYAENPFLTNSKPS
jgi:hypothetical protein